MGEYEKPENGLVTKSEHSKIYNAIKSVYEDYAKRANDITWSFWGVTDDPDEIHKVRETIVAQYGQPDREENTESCVSDLFKWEFRITTLRLIYIDKKVWNAVSLVKKIKR